MKKKLFTLFLAITACCLAASAATKYEINIAGTEVTSDNASYIGPSSSIDIESGYAVYDASSNTLTCHNLRIRRSGSGSYGIHNRKCDNLTIVFKGICQVATTDHALNLARSTTLIADAGSQLNVYAEGGGHGLNLGSYNYYINGTGYMHLNGKNSIHGNGSGSTTVYFQGAGVYTKSDFSGYKNHSLESFKAVFNEGADLTIYNNGSSTSVNNVSMYFYGKETVLSPYGAYYSNGAIYSSSGSQITSQDIYISDQYVAKLSSDYFPDANFRYYLSRQFPKGYITTNDVNATKILNASGEYIYSLQGLEYFTKLENFDCSENNLTWLPSLPSTLKILRCRKNQLTSLPNMPSGLTLLECDNNQLTTLPTMPTSIQSIDCGSNRLTSLSITGRSALQTLIVSSNNSLTTLNCSSNALTTLNVGSCSQLTEVNCSDNKFTSLDISGKSALKTLNVSNNKNLTTLTCLNDALTTLNVSNCTALSSIDCSNNKFTTLNISGFSALKSLSVSNNSNLTTLFCDNNALTSLEVSDCSALKTLFCQRNALTSLDVSSLSNLIQLECARNRLTSIDVSSNRKLKVLNVCMNELTSINVQGCTAMEHLNCYDNRLSTVSVENCSSLRSIDISLNQIKESAMGTLVNSLCTIPAGSTGEFDVYYDGNDPYEGNVITTAQVKEARNKRWYPKKYISGSWVDIPADLLGDVNGDGKINVTDITTLVNMILGVIPKNMESGDINGDGKLNVTDVTALVNIILGTS